MGRSLLVALLILGASLPARAERLFVRYGLVSGANDGSDYANAFQGPKSVKWGPGAGEVGPGDTLYICDGPYQEMLTVKASGTAESYITLDGNCSGVDPSYPNGIIGRRSLSSATTSNQGQMISVYDDAFLMIQNLTFENPMGVRHKRWYWQGARWGQHDGGDGSPSLVTSNGWGTLAANGWTGGILFNTTTGARGIITGNTIAPNVVDAKMSGGERDDLWNDGDGYFIIQDVGQITLSGSTHDVIIRNNSFDLSHPDSGFAIFFWVKSRAEIHHITIEDNTFSGAGDAAIAAIMISSTGRYHDLSIRDNVGTDIHDFFHSWGGPWIDPDGDGDTSDDSAPYGLDIDNNTVGIADGGHDFVVIHGLHEVAGSGNNTIRNNTVTTVGTQVTRTNLLQLHWCKDLIVEHNTIDGPSSKGICDGTAMMLDWAYEGVKQRYISDGVIIRHNVVRNSTCAKGGLGGINVWRGRNILIHNNLVIGSDHGIYVGGQDHAGYESDNIRIFNNTVFNSKVDGIYLRAQVTNAKILNNLVIASGDDGIDVDSASVDDGDEDHNLISDSIHRNCEGRFGGRADHTCGAQSIVDRDPLFVGGDDLTLQSTSPALNAGTDVGLPYCGPAPEIGYWERCGPGPDPRRDGHFDAGVMPIDGAMPAGDLGGGAIGDDGGPSRSADGEPAAGDNGESSGGDTGDVGAGGCSWLHARAPWPAPVVLLLLAGMMQRRGSRDLRRSRGGRSVGVHGSAERTEVPPDESSRRAFVRSSERNRTEGR